MLSQIPNLYSYTNPDYLDANRRGEITEEQAQLLGPARDFLTGKFKRGGKLNGAIVIAALLAFVLLQVLGIELTTPLVGAVIGLVLIVLAGQLGVRLTRTRRQRALLEQDLQRGSVQQGDGSLQFQGKVYTALLPDRQLVLPFGNREELAPGASYRFYYLPGSGLVLSAEALGEPTPRAVESGLTAVLAQASGFKLSSLAANRRGELTGEQIPALAGQLVAPLIFLLVPGAVLFYELKEGGYLVGEGLSGLIARLMESLTSGALLVGSLLLIACAAGLVLFVLTLWDMFGGSVKAREGPGYRVISSSQDDDGTRSTRTYYLIGGTRFRAPQGGFSAFEDGREYRAYFTPLRKILVNLEVLD